MAVTISGTSGLTYPDGTTQASGSQVCKAWVNFNASSGSGVIRTSYNVSSVTVNATGDYTINFTNAFSDANYSWFTTVSPAYGLDWMFGNINVTGTSATESAPTTTSCRMQVYGRTTAASNLKYVNAVFYR